MKLEREIKGSATLMCFFTIYLFSFSCKFIVYCCVYDFRLFSGLVSYCGWISLFICNI